MTHRTSEIRPFFRRRVGTLSEHDRVSPASRARPRDELAMYRLHRPGTSDGSTLGMNRRTSASRPGVLHTRDVRKGHLLFTYPCLAFHLLATYSEQVFVL